MTDRTYSLGPVTVGEPEPAADTGMSARRGRSDAVTRVVICGSLAHPDLIEQAVAAEEAAGREVIGYPTPPPNGATPARAVRWLACIDRADEVVIVRKPDGTIGDAVRDECHYALQRGKTARFFPSAEPVTLPVAADTGMSPDEAESGPRWYDAPDVPECMHVADAVLRVLRPRDEAGVSS